MNGETKGGDTTTTTIIKGRKTKLLYTLILVLTVIVLAIVYFIIPDIFEDRESASPKIRQMRKLTAQVGKLETDLKNKEAEFSNLVKKYYEQTGEDLPALSALGLSEEQQKVLEDKIKNQKDVSIKELLNDILKKNNEISGIKDTIKKYEALLPRPHIVIKGENHYQIAMSFLINEKGIEKERANRLVQRTALFDQLIQDFKVWNSYSGDEYGTFVTQGDAPISPNELSKKKKQELIDARDQAVAAKNRLEDDIKALESKRYELISQVKDLQGEKEELKRQTQKLSEENSEMEERIKILNTLYIIIDVEKNLIKSDILKGVFLGSPKLKDIPTKDFSPIDLREENTIEISAKKLGLLKIKRITLYPKKYYKENIDYKVEIDAKQQNATMIILNAENFKNSRIVISVE